MSKTMRNIVIFIAGPFRGADHYAIHRNICAAEALAFEAWRAGFTVMCPHMNTAHFQDALSDEVWLDGARELLLRCDAMLLVSGWRTSSGTRREREFADEKRIPVFETLSELVKWFGDKLDLDDTPVNGELAVPREDEA